DPLERVRFHRGQDAVPVRGRRHRPAPVHAAEVPRRVRVSRAGEGLLAPRGPDVRGGPLARRAGGRPMTPLQPELVIVVVKILVLFNVLLGLFSLMTYVERRLLAFMQFRLGPNRTGPFGILQPVADGIKLFFKEETMPAGANKWLFVAAPGLAIV